jgi:hypothetical protein
MRHDLRVYWPPPTHLRGRPSEVSQHLEKRAGQPYQAAFETPVVQEKGGKGLAKTVFHAVAL